MNRPRFISLRWRVLLPIYALVLVIAVTGTYLLARETDGAGDISTTNILQQSRRALDQQAGTLYETLRQTAQAIALMTGVPQAVLQGDGEAVQSALQVRARRANLDDVILTDEAGQVVLGLRRAPDRADYSLLTVDDLGETAVMQTIDQAAAPAAFVPVDGEMLLYTAVPVRRDAVLIGTVWVGRRLPWVLSSLHTSVMADAALYTPDDQLLVSTLTENPALPAKLNTVTALELGGQDYQTLYFPLELGGQTVGVVGLLLPESAALGANAARQLAGLMMAVLASAVVIVLFIALGWLIGRVGRITHTAEALARGQATARTQMQPTDEIGQLGYALDRYADYTQGRQDAMRASLRRQRRENERLMAVLEALPDGVIVQDLDGRVVVMNDTARELLGSKRVLRSNPDLKELTAFVTDRLGPALAPGIHILGEPQRIRLDDRTIHAQVAAITTVTQQRIGTVILLRDVTEAAQAEATRDEILRQMQDDVQEPLIDLARADRRLPSGEFTHEIRRHAGTLQKMILDMREMSDTHLRKVTEEQHRPLLVDTLLWAVANEWRQVAQAQNLNLHVILEKPGLYVLGEERRLRWAIGNIVDNAIKYTPPGGDLTLEVRDDLSDEQAHLRVRDNGVGITREELPHVFDRFYRGRPVTKEGRELRVHGSGQGLTVARQIFEAHGGSLTIKSKQWVGTAVYFTLPLTSPVSLELPTLAQNLEGETVRIDTRQLNAD
ncbi:MAG: PAS domain-containing protein [Anaerolineae bacterium]|nr:PAS domain-containing protein [Anaerolineae bacterium]